MERSSMTKYDKMWLWKKFPLRRRFKIIWSLVIVLLTGMMIPQHFQMPVVGATQNDFNQESFWYYPWGRSVTHKGVDIFAEKGTTIKSSVKGFVVYQGNIEMGGNIVLILGPKWRLHYFAHLDTIAASSFEYVDHHSTIGDVGDSGNAKGKPPHLHYSIITPLPYFWKIDTDIQGWKKMFILDPIEYLNEVGS
ncbi:M23 family metallopeptidase [Sungkyunkwania multivorans]|uniref:M23 family metallopeptidase n=1 Tax=Sungkyunkwania multivorans TaxID=1173618 RepID=A0ABW3CXM1_9FLAO